MNTFRNTGRISAGIALGIAAAALSWGTTVHDAKAAEITPALKKVVEAANKEGEMNVTWSSNTFGGAEGAKKIEKAINDSWGAKIRIKWNPGRSMPEVGNQVAMSYKNKLPSPTDVYLGFSRNMATLHKYDMFLSSPWKDYAPARLTDAVVEQNGSLVKVYSATVGFSYNKKLAPMQPERLEDLLRPEWKGKIATPSYGPGWDQVAAADMWGAKKSIAFAKKFAGQVSAFARCSEMERLTAGEFLALALDCSGTSTYEAIAAGAPLARVIPPDLNIVSYFYLGIPKNSKAPNIARLFVTYMLSADGQKMLAEERGGSCLHVFPECKIGQEIAAIEKKYNVKFVNSDVAWQIKNKEGNKAQREIKKLITRK